MYTVFAPYGTNTLVRHNDMEKQKIIEIEEIVAKILESAVSCFAIGGFGKYLNNLNTDIKDLDFYIPFELNNLESLRMLLVQFDKRYILNNYNFDKILRIKYKSIKIDLLPKINGVNFITVLQNYEIKYFNKLPIQTLSQNKIEENINFVQKQFE